MNKFTDYSKEIVTNFLQTVVVIDDEAYLNPSCNNSLTVEEVEELPLSLGRGESTRSEQAEPSRSEQAEPSEESEEVNLEESVEESSEEEHTLNAKLLSDKFADLGLLCTALRPENGDIGIYKKVLKKADIVILDWKLKVGEADGATVKDLIKEIIYDSDENVKKSLRSIVIYSGEDGLEEKLKSVKTYLKTELSMIPSSIDTYALKYEKLQIKIYAKKVQRGKQDTTVKLNEEKLVDVIIQDFVNQTAGLVPNIAIQALAELRQNTHKILGVFSKDLDEAYLSHRAMLPHPQDAESFMIDIFISELQSILEDSKKIYEVVDIEQIMNWIKKEFDDDRLLRIFFNNDIVDSTKTNKHTGIKTKFNIEDNFQLANQENFSTASAGIVKYRRELLYELLEQIFSQGYTNTINCELIKQKKFNPKEFTSYFFKDDFCANENENKFAMMSTTKNKYSKPTPYLSLGTILRNNKKYYVCIIPRCDAARIENNEQQFPFLYLKPVSDGQKFDIVLKGSEGFLKFKIDYKSYNIFVQSFRKPIKYYDITNKPLYANEVNGQYAFVTHSDDCYMWITELKNERAQAISNHFSAQLSRVGFNESEYLRRSYE